MNERSLTLRARRLALLEWLLALWGALMGAAPVALALTVWRNEMVYVLVGDLALCHILRFVTGRMLTDMRAEAERQ